MYPLVLELAEDGTPVAVTCRVLKIARQPYYRWLANPVTDAELVAAYRANALLDAHRDDPEFGYRFLLDEARDAGEPMAERTAWKVCSDLGWWSAFGKKSFFSLLQKNALDRRTWNTREGLRIAIVTWIERTYHRRRRQDALGRLTPPRRPNADCHPFVQQTLPIP